MRSPDDRDLAEKATHDPEAFGALYDRYFGEKSEVPLSEVAET